MKNKTAIKAVLGQLEFLLSQHGEPEWAKALCRFQVQIEDDDSNGRYNLRGLFGGMGSLNDVVLQKNARPLFSENDELAALREQLFEPIH